MISEFEANLVYTESYRTAITAQRICVSKEGEEEIKERKKQEERKETPFLCLSPTTPVVPVSSDRNLCSRVNSVTPSAVSPDLQG